MGFSASIRDGHLLKRGRDSDGTDTDQKLYCESSDEGRTYRFSKRSRSSSSNSVEEFMGFDEEEDMVFTSQQPDFYGSLREETADSESFTSKVYYDSENFSPPFCRDNSTSTTKIPVPDDAQSSTSDSCCCCCDSCDYDNEYEDDDSDEGELSSSASTSAPAQSFINYLFEASDDDLGLPPVHCRYDDMYQNQSNAHLHAVDLDLGLDLDLDLDVEDHQLLVF